MNGDERLKLRAQLDQIDKWLQDDDGTSRALWNVICALRGPDDEGEEDDHRKDEFTIPIRRAAFPALTKAIEAGDIYVGSRFDTTYELHEHPAPMEHFTLHAQWAIEALLETTQITKLEDEPVEEEEDVDG